MDNIIILFQKVLWLWAFIKPNPKQQFFMGGLERRLKNNNTTNFSLEKPSRLLPSCKDREVSPLVASPRLRHLDSTHNFAASYHISKKVSQPPWASNYRTHMHTRTHI